MKSIILDHESYECMTKEVTLHSGIFVPKKKGGGGGGGGVR